MAIYHCSIKIFSRSGGKSAVAAAAYRAGEKLLDKETGIIHDYTRKGGVIHSEIILPENAPTEYADRATLWNAVQEVEKQSNAQLAREIEVALPVELTREQQLGIVHNYVKETFVKEGMCADWALHDKGNGNPHAHIMLTTRAFKENGEWSAKEKKVYKLDENGERIPIIDHKTGKQKIGKNNRKMWQRETVQSTDWSDRSKAEIWREAWARECNKYLDEEQQIDHRSFARQGIDLEPTIHEGYVAREIERYGGVSELCQTNREIRARNSHRLAIREALRNASCRLAELFRFKKSKKPQTPKADRPIEKRIEKELASVVGLPFAENRDAFSAPEPTDPVIEEPHEGSAVPEPRRNRNSGSWWTRDYSAARKNLYGTKDTKPNFPKALKLLQGEAEKQNGYAMYDLGKMHLSGLGCEKDEALAQKWFARAFSAFLAEQAKAENPAYLQYRIGKLYAFGHGVGRDYTKAAAWYKRAVAAHNPFAAYSLAGLYRRGRGVEEDNIEAYQLYKTAAEDPQKPNSYAAYELGRMCAAGIGVAQNATEAEAWYQRAYQGFLQIEQDSTPDDKLYYRLGRMNLDGLGTKADLEKAKNYFEMAAEMKNENAMYGLGKLHLLTESDVYDPQAAEKYLLAAAENGHEQAQYLIGKLYFQGDELRKDENAARTWLEKAAAQGNHLAEYQLGKLYLFGTEIPHDYEKGVAYLSAAAEHGDPYADATLRSRRVARVRIQELGNALLTLRREGIERDTDFALRAKELKARIKETQETLDRLKQKNSAYTGAAKYLEAYSRNLPVVQQYEKLHGRKKVTFGALHEGELTMFRHTESRLKEMGVNTNVDPRKVMVLLHEQEEQQAQLQAELNEVRRRVERLQSAEKCVSNVRRNDLDQEKQREDQRQNRSVRQDKER